MLRQGSAWLVIPKRARTPCSGQASRRGTTAVGGGHQAGGTRNLFAAHHEVPAGGLAAPAFPRRATEANQLRSLHAVQAFLDDHRPALAGIATGGARRRLDESLAALEQHVVEQSASELVARGLTQRYRALRRRLIRAHLVPVALIARAAEPPVAGLESFRIPRGKPTAQLLAATAHGMAKAATPFAETFIAAGLPDDFADRMVRAADAMIEALTARTQEWARHRAATAGLRIKLASARRLVRVLDAFVTSGCETDDGLLAGWASATHVRRTGRRAAGPDEQKTLATAIVGEPAMNEVESTRVVLLPSRTVPFGDRVLALFVRARVAA